MRVNQGQEFVIAGYTSSPKNFDAIIFGYYDGPKLIYAARTRNGFTPASREKLFKAFKGLEVKECPFANLPEASGGRWGQGLTADKMNDCRWLTPALVGQFEFLEWTPDRHLRHARFVRLRDDKNAQRRTARVTASERVIWLLGLRVAWDWPGVLIFGVRLIEELDRLSDNLGHPPFLPALALIAASSVPAPYEYPPAAARGSCHTPRPSH